MSGLDYDYLVTGGDARFMRLAELLYARGKRVGTIWNGKAADAGDADISALSRARNVVVNDPPRLRGVEMSFDELLAAVSGDARVFACGPGHPKADGRVIDLWADEALISENARLTAEGALSAAMAASDLAIRDARCLVIGWGRIGRALTELLVGVGARVTVASRSGDGRNRASAHGARTVDTGEIDRALPDCDLAFNTAPAMVLDDSALAWVNPRAMLVDLASAPYGIDLRSAWRRGLRAWREPGLPGRYCPRSAARALLEGIEQRGL